MPPVLIETPDFLIREVLATLGLKFSAKSRVVSKAEAIDILYKGEEADIIPGSFGVSSGDPDGIYHILGKQGAITSPMNFNQTISSLLETGRSLVAKEEVASFYQNVTKKILEEVPIIHLGFTKAISIYRHDKLKVKGKFKIENLER